MEWLLAYFFIFDVSFLLALWFTPLFRRLSFAWKFVDEPTLERKIHKEPMPLMGGAAVFAAFAFNVVFNYLVTMRLVFNYGLPFMDVSDLSKYQLGAIESGVKLAAVLAGGAGMVLLGMRDDKNDLHARAKFIGQIVIAGVVAASGIRLQFFSLLVSNPILAEIMNYGLTIFWIITITNAMNFLDNMDGLCGGVGMVCALLFAFVAGIRDQYFVCVLALAFAGALLGFLPYNFKPASIFLGDMGSHFVGFMLAVLPIMATFYQKDSPTWLPILIPLLVLAVPLLDMFTVIGIRLRNGTPIYHGDRNHISHRLVGLGLPQSWAVALIYLITLTLGLGAMVLLWADTTAAVLVIIQTCCVFAIITLLERLGGR
jgi:UDP-GlcNAc:undecaprenyl-phosphate GlcNAc-1-phosphate transferase